ncbi:MAG TPA: phospholipid carrier-dependent glycosyltransferase, partial [Verrucomicrobiae bacterium]
MPSIFEKAAAFPQRAILLFSLALLLMGNWILPLTDRDEARFGEASREMLQRGDYVVPWFNGHWRFDKPIFIYWCQSASYRVLGDNPFAARLPSALFTTGIALMLVRWGRKVTGDNQTALIAGAMFVAGLHVAIIGRVATADMALIFFYTVSAWSGWELTRPESARRKFWWWTFYLSLALGFLAKGPEAWLPLIAMVLGRVLRKDSFRLPLI